MSLSTGIVHSVKWTPVKWFLLVRCCESVCVFIYRYCPQCKVDTSEVVLAGERLKESKKKCKMASSQSATSRDWGKVFVCLLTDAPRCHLICHFPNYLLTVLILK